MIYRLLAGIGILIATYLLLENSLGAIKITNAVSNTSNSIIGTLQGK